MSVTGRLTPLAIVALGAAVTYLAGKKRGTPPWNRAEYRRRSWLADFTGGYASAIATCTMRSGGKLGWTAKPE